MMARFSNSSYLIHHLLEKSADACPDKEAVIHDRSRYTYQDIEENANRIASWLLNSGLQPGERVALLLRNSIEYICAYYGILKTGGIVVPLNTGLDSRELAWMIDDCGATVIISEIFFSEIINSMQLAGSKQIKLLAMIDSSRSLENPTGCTIFADIYAHYSPTRPQVKLIDREFASIIYTSGSTGRPKGVMLSHLNVLTNTRSIVSYLELTSSDRCMVVLPFYYVYGKSLLNIHFAVSGSIIIDNRFTFPNVVLKNMIAERATGFAGVSSTYAILVNKSSVAKMRFQDLRYITQAGGHMPSELKSKLLAIFPDKKIFIMYGATEASARLSYLPPEKLAQEIHSIGKAIPNVKIKILRENGTEAAVDEEGEIVACGSNIMLGYWNNPEETQKVLKNGWYYTGDLGEKNRYGFISVTGRKRDMIKVGIYKVSAVEIEEVLHKYPEVHEAAVIGIPDDILGETLRAFVVIDMQTSVTDSDLIEFCSASLPDYKIPKQIVFLESLPKNDAGKILKQRLKSLCPV